MSVVEEIKERLDIVEVISAYVPLRKAGNVYKGLCPFHQEKTPSFVVYPDRGTWHCFGACGTGGDVFSFVMKRDNLDFREALEALAQKAGVNLAPPSAARSQQEQTIDRLREINQAAAVYFHHQLRHAPQGQGARDYLAPSTPFCWAMRPTVGTACWPTCRARTTNRPTSCRSVW